VSFLDICYVSYEGKIGNSLFYSKNAGGCVYACEGVFGQHSSHLYGIECNLKQHF